MKYKKEYLEAKGTFCPFCKGDDITGGPVEIDDGYALQEVTCVDCHATWQDQYKLKFVVKVNEEGE